MKLYVLRENKSLKFICYSKTIDDLKKKLNRCYWNYRACQPSGSNYTMDDYMKNKTISEIIISDLNISEIIDNLN